MIWIGTEMDPTRSIKSGLELRRIWDTTWNWLQFIDLGLSERNLGKNLYNFCVYNMRCQDKAIFVSISFNLHYLPAILQFFLPCILYVQCELQKNYFQWATKI